MQGTRARATAATGMNQRSSRSHAIFTITLEQRARLAGGAAPDAGDDSGEDDEGRDDYLCAKMHLVDLAGQLHARASRVPTACRPCIRASRQRSTCQGPGGLRRTRPFLTGITLSE